MNMGISRQPSVISHQENRRWSLVVGPVVGLRPSVVSKSTKHHLPAIYSNTKMLRRCWPEHWLYLMAES
jgi:hypothetical protein